ncbi:MAG: FG-GAP-like repeat-containing protein [Planctomycetales bacterium]
MTAEVLEDRTLLSTVALGDPGSQIILSGEFNASNVATGEVQISFDETNPLLAIENGQVTADTSAGTFSIQPVNTSNPVSITLYTLSGNPTIWQSTATTPVTFTADELISGGHDFTQDNGTAEPISVAGLTNAFTATNLALQQGTPAAPDDLINLQGQVSFASVGLSALTALAEDDQHQVEIDSVTKNVTLTGVVAQLAAPSFTFAGLNITGSLNVGYSDQGGNVFTFGGSVTATSGTTAGSTPDFSLGGTLDMTIENGQIEAITLAITGSFTVFDLNIAPNQLTFEYNTQQQQFVMYGDLAVKIANGKANDAGSDSTSVTGQFGDATDPGLIVDAATGDVTQVNIAVYGTLNVLGFVFESPQANPATFQYSAAEGLYELSGEVTLPKFWNASVTMGTASQPGIKIQNGNWSIDALDVGLSDVALGAFTIKNFDVSYTQSGTDLDIDANLNLVFPQSWMVQATIDTSFNTQTNAFEVDSVSVEASNLHVPIADTGLFLTGIDASLQNLDQPSNLIVSGGLTVEFGDEVSIFGATAHFFLAQGNFTVDKDELVLAAQVWIGSVVNPDGTTTGLLGTASGQLVLDWSAHVYSLNVEASLYDGVFTFQGAFQFNAGTNSQPPQLVISAQADVNVPQGVPLIGGKQLGSLDFLLNYQAPQNSGDPAQGFVAAWADVNLLVTHVEAGIEYTFADDSVKLIGSSQINALQKSAVTSTPPNSTVTTSNYSQAFTNSAAATAATLSVDWTRTFSSPPTSVTVSVILPDGTTVNESDFATNGLNLITTSSSGEPLNSATQVTIGVVNPTATTSQLQGAIDSINNLITVSDTTGLNGWAVSGNGIPAGTTAIVLDSQTLKPSQAATSSVSNTALTFTNTYDALPLASNQSYTSYTLQVQFTSDAAPLNDSAAISTITRATDGTSSLITFAGTVPTNLYVGDTITIAGSNVSNYNSTNTWQVTQLTATGAVINQPFTSDASGGTLSGWTLPQFNATFHIPQPTIYFTPVTPSVSTSNVTVSMPVQVSSGLGIPTVTLYIDEFNASAGANQDFNGIPLPASMALNPGAQGQYTATTTAGLSQSLGLLPIQYYLYAVVNDGLNTPVTSTLTSNGSGSFNEVFDNVYALTGNISNQLNQELNGWTVYVDLNNNGILDPGDPSDVTADDGFYGFYATDLANGPSTYSVVLQMLDPSAFVAGANGLTQAVPWDGSDPVSADFQLNQFSSVSGTVFDSTTLTGLANWTVYLDANGNKRRDRVELSTQTASDGSYSFTNLENAAIESITSSGGPSPTTVLNLAAAAPLLLNVGDTITVSGNSESAYNTTHVISAIGGQSLTTNIPYTTIGSGGVLYGPNVSLSVALLLQNGSAATYDFDTGTVSGREVDDSSNSPNAQQQVGKLKGASDIGTATQFGIADHPNAQNGNQILQLNPASPATGFVEVANQSDLEPGTGAFSVTGWFYATDMTQNQTFAGLLEDGGNGVGGWTLGLTQTSQFGVTPTGQITYDSGGTLPQSVAAGDFNNDGLQDLVVANTGDGKMTILLNSTIPDQQFNQQPSISVGASSQPYSVAVGDFNLDGKLDFVVANNVADNVSAFPNTTTTGASSTTFGAPTIVALDGNSSPQFVAVADFDGDGKPDFAVVDSALNQVSVFLNTSTGSPITFAAAYTKPTGTSPGCVAVADFDGNGLPDLAMTNSGDDTVSVILNFSSIGNLSFSGRRDDFAVGSSPDYVAVGDFNADGRPDLAVTNNDSGDVSILLNAQRQYEDFPRFATQVTFDTGDGSSSAAVADFDGNGSLDIAVANYGSSNVVLLLNQTPTNASTPAFFSLNPGLSNLLGSIQNLRSIVAADLDGDQVPDLAWVDQINSSKNNVCIAYNFQYMAIEALLVTQSGAGDIGTASYSVLSYPTPITSGYWYHYAFTYDANAAANGAGAVTLFLDGASVSNIPLGILPTSPTISSPSGLSFNIGNSGGNAVTSPFSGYVDDVSVWDDALSAAQIQALYNGTTSLYSQTAPANPATYAVSLSGLYDLSQSNDFSISQLGTIAGSVQANVLAGAQLDAAPRPAQGWTVNLRDASGHILTTTTTNAAGLYVFPGLFSGTYSTQLVPPAGWRQTSAAQDGLPVTLNAGDRFEHQDFAAAELGQIRGILFDDLDGNGRRDAGESGRTGRLVYLDVNQNQKYDSGIDIPANTVNAGAFAFAGLADGSWPLRLQPIPGRIPTGPAQGFYQVTIANGAATVDRAYDFSTRLRTLQDDFLPIDLSGPWVVNGSLAQINQSSASLTISDENGGVSAGVATSFGRISGRNGLTGTLDTTTADWGRLVWSDGVVWQRLSLGGQFFNPANQGLTSVMQNGMQLTFTNVAGGTTIGNILNATTISATGWNQTATLVDGRLRFFNGSVWKRLELAPRLVNVHGDTVGILQNGTTILSFVNRLGQTSIGKWISPTQVVAMEWNVTGLVADGRIVWSNNTVWSKNLQVFGTGATGGEVSLTESNGQVILTNRRGGTSHAKIMDDMTLIALDWGGVIGTRLSGGIEWSNRTTWSNFDFNALDAVFADKAR